jgi:GNAT superfamily N-acetyltransferase
MISKAYRLSDDPAELDMERIFHWLSGESYWARGRERDVVERSFANSVSVGVYTGDQQVAVARLVTDAATFAWLADVYVDPAHRGHGLGSWMTRWAVDWTDARGVQRFVLATRDAHEVYARAGFEPVLNPDLWMEIDRRPTRLTTRVHIPVAKAR